MMLRTASAGMPAAVSGCLSTATHSFRAHGFAVIRAKKGETSAALTTLNTAIHALYATTKDTWAYRWWRYFHSVNSPELRHVIPLPTHLCDAVLRDSVRNVKPLLDTLLNPNSALVELNAFVSLPGSVKQKVHADIGWEHSQRFIITGFVALHDVGSTHGPTCIFASTCCALQYPAPLSCCVYMVVLLTSLICLLVLFCVRDQHRGLPPVHQFVVG